MDGVVDRFIFADKDKDEASSMMMTNDEMSELTRLQQHVTHIHNLSYNNITKNILKNITIAININILKTISLSTNIFTTLCSILKACKFYFS